MNSATYGIAVVVALASNSEAVVLTTGIDSTIEVLQNKNWNWMTSLSETFL